MNTTYALKTLALSGLVALALLGLTGCPCPPIIDPGAWNATGAAQRDGAGNYILSTDPEGNGAIEQAITVPAPGAYRFEWTTVAFSHADVFLEIGGDFDATYGLGALGNTFAEWDFPEAGTYTVRVSVFSPRAGRSATIGSIALVPYSFTAVPPCGN